MLQQIENIQALGRAHGNEAESGNVDYQEEFIDLMYDVGRQSSTISGSGGTVTFLLFFMQGDSIQLWIWFIALLLTTTARFVLFEYHDRYRDEKTQEFWLRAHMQTGVACGIAWGLLALHPVSNLSMGYQALVLVVPTFIATGAINAYGIILAQYRAFLIALFASLIICHTQANGMEVLPTHILFIFVAGGLYWISKRFQQTLLDSMVAHRRLSVMNEQLSGANDELAKQHAINDQEHEMAAHVFNQLTLGSAEHEEGLHSWNQPMGNFSGDLILVNKGAKGKTYAMLGDFTGHGLPAALGAVPAAAIFRAMASKGMPVGEIARELHAKLGQLLPVGYFCCAVVMEIDRDRQQVHIWNGGLPPVLVYNGESGEIEEFASSNVPLGVGGMGLFDDSSLSIEMKPGSRMLVYSDGVTEAMDPAGDQWGAERLHDFLLVSSTDRPCLPGLKRELQTFIADGPNTDDVSIIEYLPGR